MAAMAGLLTETNKVYNQDKNGHFYAPGEMIKRNFKNHETEFYLRTPGALLPALSSLEACATRSSSLPMR